MLVVRTRSLASTHGRKEATCDGLEQDSRHKPLELIHQDSTSVWGDHLLFPREVVERLPAVISANCFGSMDLRL